MFLTSILSQKYIPYLGFFSYTNDIRSLSANPSIRALSNFDGIFYIRIALHGYSKTEQAYFPLYPMLISLLNRFVHNPIAAGALISNFSFILGALFFLQYLQSFLKRRQLIWTALFLLFYPTAHYFGVLYTESLYFCLFFGTLLSLKKGHVFLASLLAFMLALTRVTGVLVCIPLFFLFLKSKPGNLSNKPFDWVGWIRSQWRFFLVLISSFTGLVSYGIYLWKTVGDPLYFLHAQESFGAHRSSRFITPFQVLFRYLKILGTADYSFQYLVAILELIFFLLSISIIGFGIWRLWKEWKLKRKLRSGFWDCAGLAVYSLALLIVPSLTGTLTAVPRYSLNAYSIFLVLGSFKQKRIKIVLLIAFSLLQLLYHAGFIQGYYLT